MKMVSLSGANYHFWKSKMRDLLFVKNMHIPIFGTKKPDSMSDEEWGFECERVCGLIRHFIDELIYNLISHCRNLPFCGRARRGSRVRLPKKENARSRHQRLLKGKR